MPAHRAADPDHSARIPGAGHGQPPARVADRNRDKGLHSAAQKPQGAILEYDTGLYKTRNIIERMFNRLKYCRQLSLRTFRCPETFLAAAHITATVIWCL